MKRKQKKSLPWHVLILSIFLTAALLFTYWDRNDPATYVNELGGLVLSIPLSVGFYASVSHLAKRESSVSSDKIARMLSKYSWVIVIGIVVACMTFIFPGLTHVLLVKYGASESAYVTEHYFTYDTVPIGSLNSLLSGAKKTDEFNATTEVIRYKIANRNVSGTIDFPYNAYFHDAESPVNQQIRQHHTIQIRYLHWLPFIAQSEASFHDY